MLVTPLASVIMVVVSGFHLSGHLLSIGFDGIATVELGEI